MAITKKMKEHMLPNPTSQEHLECSRFRKVLTFGDKVLVAARYYDCYKDLYIAAVYEHLDDDLSIEGIIGLVEVSKTSFEDDGHAIAWAIANA